MIMYDGIKIMYSEDDFINSWNIFQYSMVWFYISSSLEQCNVSSVLYFKSKRNEEIQNFLTFELRWVLASILSLRVAFNFYYLLIGYRWREFLSINVQLLLFWFAFIMPMYEHNAFKEASWKFRIQARATVGADIMCIMKSAIKTIRQWRPPLMHRKYIFFEWRN